MKIFRKWFWKDFYYNQISSRIWPRQWWLIKQIPRDWCDKNTILEIVVFACIRHYIEKDGEDALNVLSNDNPPHQAQFIKELKEMYNDICVTIPQLEKELDLEWDKISPTTNFDSLAENINKSTTPKEDYQRKYGKIEELEGRIEAVKTKVCLWTINRRAEIWT